jgi:hypothetical protein
MQLNHSHNLFAGNYVNYDDWKSYTVTWASTSQTTTPQTDAWISDNSLGYWNELALVGTTSGTPAITGSPVSELRPVVDLSVLTNANEVLVRNISFHCLDVRKNDSEAQDSATNNAITNSLTDNNQANVQTRFVYSVPPDWQPNYFRPEFIINNRDLLGNSGSTTNFGTKNNQGDKSIGMPLPLSYTFDYHFTGIKSIKVNALCYQYIEFTNLFKRYALICHADFLYR